MPQNTDSPTRFHNHFHRLVNRYNALEGKSQDYGCGIELHLAEIHTINAIGNHPESHIAGVARSLGVTRGSTQQMVGKLMKKGLVEKFMDPDDKKRVYLRLTAMGALAFDGHDKYHAELDAYVTTYFDSRSAEEVKSLWVSWAVWTIF